MIVLGAQWCHDSRAVAAQFSKSEMQTILDKEYEVAFIDVGYLEDRRDITQNFSYPTYFATPTVMIVDPISQKLVNLASLPKWSSGASVKYDEYIKDFGNISAMLGSTGVQSLTKELSQFEETQSQRLASAYQVLGPLLAKDEQKTLTDKQAFYDLWEQVKDFRTQLQKDIHRLRTTHPSKLNSKIIKSSVQIKQPWELLK